MHYVDQRVTVQSQITDISRCHSVQSVWKAPLDYYYILSLFVCDKNENYGLRHVSRKHATSLTDYSTGHLTDQWINYERRHVT